MFLEALLTIAKVSPDATLAQRLRQKDVHAFEQRYDRHSRIVHQLLPRIVQPAGTAEEVAQDAFTLSSSSARKAGQYDESRGPFVPWLLNLAPNRALDTQR